MTPVYTDHEWLRDLKQGSDSAYKELFKRFHEPILFTAYQRVRDRHVAEDIASEAFIKIFESRQDFESVAHLKNYLFKAAYHASMDYLRCRQTIPSNIEQADESIIIDNLETQIVQADYIVRLRRVIEELPARQRDTILALAFDGKRYKEVAREMGLTSVKAVKKNRSRGILNLVKRVKSGKAAEVVFLLLSLLLIKK